MPRRDDPDEQDRKRPCPMCNGLGTVYRDHLEAHVQCPYCYGQCVVTQAKYDAYLRLNNGRRGPGRLPTTP